MEDLKKLQKDALAATSDDEKDILKLADSLKDIDTKIRDIVDYIFDSNVSEICAPYGSMYDVVNGKCRFECIIESLSTLYENNIIEEISNSKDTKYLILNDKYNKNWQTPLKVIDYVKENKTKTGEIEIFDIYE